jgi:hypothetical protein
MNALRACLPPLVLTVALLALVGARRRRSSWVERGFWVYGLIMLLSGILYEATFPHFYYGIGFLGVVATAELGLRGRDAWGFAVRLNWASWIITTLALAALLFFARDALYAPDSDSAYGVLNRYQDQYGLGMSRSTGLSRMAVVPAIISLSFVLSGDIRQRLAAGTVFLGACYVIWIMQSRGAFFSFSGALFFMAAFGNRGRRAPFILYAVAIAACVIPLVAPPGAIEAAWSHVTRSEGTEAFARASGRYDIYSLLWEQWLQSPILGYGPEGDRIFGCNAQNAWLYALMCGGVVGMVFFSAAMLAAWRALIVIAARASPLPSFERRMFQITGTFLVFCTLRSIPENNAAVFSIDQLLQYPAMIYLSLLAGRLKDLQTYNHCAGRSVLAARAAGGQATKPLPSLSEGADSQRASRVGPRRV